MAITSAPLPAPAVEPPPSAPRDEPGLPSLTLPALGRPSSRANGKVFTAQSLKGVLLLGDVAAVATSLGVASLFPAVELSPPLAPFLALSVAIILGLYLAESYEAHVYREPAGLTTRLLIGGVVSLMAAGVMAFLFPQALLTRVNVAAFYLTSIPVFALWRIGGGHTLRRRLTPERVAVVGSGDAAKELIEAFAGTESHELAMIVASNGDGEVIVSDDRGPASHAQLVDLPTIVADAGVKLVAVALPSIHREALYRQLLSLRYLGIEVQDMASCFEMLSERLPVRYLEDEWVAFSSRFLGWDHGFEDKLKRLLDVSLATLGLVVFAPLMLLIAVAIRLTSRGPAVFAQKRVGVMGESYTIYKFRSMRQGAEENGAVWAEEGDPRVTAVGSLLRKVHLDELPQLWNVLRGDMSVVGPRPERPVFVDELRRRIPYYDLRHVVKPGLTGWAQVRFPYAASVDDSLAKLEYDLYYIRHKNLLWDLRIILRTLTVSFTRRGSR